MKTKEIEEILESHQDWLYNPDSGKRANFSGKNLSGVFFPKVNMSKVLFMGANLYKSCLSGVVLNESNFTGAHLAEADLSYSFLKSATFKDANLKGANFHNAYLLNTNLTDARYNHNTIGIHPAPEGDLIGWGKKSGVIVKLLIPAKAKRSCSTGRKYRAEYAECVEVYNGNKIVKVYNRYNNTVYKEGYTVISHFWDNNRWNECTGGIHFFLTRQEAEEYTI